MTTAIRKPRQTAGNNAFLGRCRRWFNDPIYRRCLGLVNAEGEAAACRYLLGLWTREWVEANVAQGIAF